jgi:hypothetical protein
VREHELEADQERARERGELDDVAGARHEGEHARGHDERDLERRLERGEVGVAGVLGPVPDRERRRAVELPAERPVPEDAGGVQRVRLEKEDPEAERGREEEAAEEEKLLPRPAQRARVRRPEREEQERRKLRPRREAGEEPARGGRRDEDEPPDEERRHDRVVRVRARHVLREGIGGPRERERGAEAGAAEAKAEEREPEQGDAVPEDGRQVRSGQVVPLVAPAEHGEAGHVGQVAHGPVGVAAAVGDLAAPVRLDPLADVAVGVRVAALLAVVGRHVPVRRLAVLDDPLRADDPGEADVDHVRGAHVQADPEAHEEDGGGEEHPHRPERPGRAAAPLPPDPRHAPEQVEERRVRERHRREDLAAVEEPERDAEREQDEQVEVSHRAQPAQVGEADEEDRAEGEPDPGVVDLAAERAAVPAGHLPGHLRARPRLGHLARLVVHLRQGDLARVGQGRPDSHRPDARLAEVGRVGERLLRVALEPARDLRRGERALDRLVLAQHRLRRHGGERRPDEVPARVVHRRRRRLRVRRPREREGGGRG